MDALTIRRYKGFRMPQYPDKEVGRAEKQTASSAAKSVAKPAGPDVSNNLRQLMDRVGRLENQIRENHRTLQTGEAVLDEVQNSLERMAELARQAADGGDPAALQKELEHLRDEIGRMLSSASVDGEKLFLDDAAGIEESLEALLEAVADEAAEGTDNSLPDWLVNGITQGSLTAEQILASLGLDETASSADILAAIADRSLEDDPALGYLAALYLGAVISGNTESIDETGALQGLQQLLEQVADGVPLDEAIETLTNGAFTSMADFESQFLEGAAPGLETFLSNLLLADTASLLLDDLSSLALLANFEGMQTGLLSMLFNALQSPETAAETQNTQNAETAVNAESAENAAVSARAAAPAASADPAAGTSPAPAASSSAPTGTAAAQAVQVIQYGTVEVSGRDLSGVSFDAAKNTLTISGTADVVLQGTGQSGTAVLLDGTGKVTLREVHIPLLTVGNPAARIASVHGNIVEELRFQRGASLTASGSGRLETGTLRTAGGNALRLTGGAVVIQQEAGTTQTSLNIPVVVDGPISFAAHAAHVSTPEGKALEPFDIVWKTLLPGWTSISAMAVDGRQAKMELLHEQHPARLWMNRGDSGYPIHTVTIKGRDKSGQARTRYAYLRWNQRAGAFEEITMYPNPFHVTGGEEHRDWLYEAESHTLRILTSQVTAISGGMGTDANEAPFSGRIALADNTGTISLTLGGTACRVLAGRAFSLGRGNTVTLLLKSGSDNHFESGAGYAGISLLDGTTLCIDCAAPHSTRDPAGTLTASGGSGGAGIGRDGRGSRDRTSSIEIRGGIITATGTGGGAGIGAGKRSAMGAILITGGVITATGSKGGGAGIGGALHAPVGDISIRGGTITATAAEHAAAIGAGIQGESGNILITGSARIKKAVGGDPGADIGACLFGGCGNVQITADIGCARLCRRSGGVPLRMGEDTVTLPQFRLSVRSLRLDRLSVLTREYAQNAVSTIGADRRWIAQIQDIYSALYTQIEQSRILNTRQYVSMAEGLVRDTDTASTLLNDMRQSIPTQSAVHTQKGKKDVRRLFQ